MNDIYGTDIMIGDDGDFIVSTDGDVALVTGLECLKQDVRHRLMTYPGDLFYDENYGVGIQQFINIENQEINRQHLIQLIKVKLEEEPRILLNSVSANILSWESGTIKIEVSYIPINENNPENIILSADSTSIEVK